jgi:hypothetical protein
MKPMHFAMALLSAAMFFILAGVFMGVGSGSLSAPPWSFSSSYCALFSRRA